MAEAPNTEDVRCVCGRLLFRARGITPDSGEIEIKCGKCGGLVTWRLGRTLVLQQQQKVRAAG